MDYGAQYADRELLMLQKKIKRIYAEAQGDIEAKLDDFNRKYKVKEAIHLKEVANGTMTQEEFDRWKKGQVFQGKQWKAKKEQIADTLYNANSEAVKIINGGTISVFAENANYAAYMLEKGARVNLGFGLYDSTTVTNLIKNDPNVLPFKKMNKAKDVRWNFKKIRNQLTQGIVQGESLDKIAKRLSTVTGSQNMSQMLTHARTAMTSAQNAGRQIRYEEASKNGIKLHKEWIATFDSHTRDAHRKLDGQKVEVDKPFKVDGYEIDFPGDPHAQPYLVYNCRCTMVADLDEYPDEYKRYDNIDGKPVSQMTYEEWYNAKEGITEIELGQFTIGTAKTVEEINDFMNSQEWWKSRRVGGRHAWNKETGRYEIVGMQTVETKADLTGCDLESAKSIASAYQQTFERYPQLKGKFEAPNAQPVGMKEDTYAWCYTKSTGQVQVNPSMYSNWETVVKDYEHDILTRWHPPGTTAESIVTHELGHAIDGLLAREGVLGGVTSSGEYRLASSSLKQTVMNRAAKQDPDLKELMDIDRLLKDSSAVENYVSRYAAKNPQEWFAECFAEYITSASPRLVATEFGKELEKLLGKLAEAVK